VQAACACAAALLGRHVVYCTHACIDDIPITQAWCQLSGSEPRCPGHGANEVGSVRSWTCVQQAGAIGHRHMFPVVETLSYIRMVLFCGCHCISQSTV
jgi:hypothetical protein